MRHLGCGVYVLRVRDSSGLLITERRADFCVHAHLAAGLRGGPSHVCRAQIVLSLDGFPWVDVKGEVWRFACSQRLCHGSTEQ